MQAGLGIRLQHLGKGWSRENIGSHIVRNNVIHDCGATGICANFEGAFSEICGNHIYRISTPEFGIRGGEQGGIKLHAAIDTVIEHNLIHDAWRGIWLDWQA